MAQYYLELDPMKALDLAHEAYDLLLQASPYQTMSDDFIHLLSIELMLATSDPSFEADLAFPQEVLLFVHDDRLIKKLPLKTQSLLEKKTWPLCEITAKDLPSFTGRFLLFGQEAKFPLSLPCEGQYLLHLQKESEIKAVLLKMKSKKPSVKKLWSRSLWREHNAKTLRTFLEASRPVSLKSAGLTVIIQGERQEPLPLLLSSPPVTESVSFQPPPAPKKIQASPLMEDPWKEEEKPEDRPLWKSPWFWVGVGVVMGAGGYLIYEANRDPVVVTTP